MTEESTTTTPNTQEGATTSNADSTDAPKKKEKKKPPPGLVIPPKRPKLTKAERRALQEKQRAAKAAAQGGKGNKQLQPTPKKHVLAAQATAAEAGKGQSAANKENAKKNDGIETLDNNQRNNPRRGDNDCLDLFSHLPRYKGKRFEFNAETKAVV